MTVPFIFSGQTGTIPLSELDSNFSVAAGPNSSSQIATSLQTVFTVPTYIINTNSLKVYINGVKQILGSSYAETNSTTVTFYSGVPYAAIVEFTG